MITKSIDRTTLLIIVIFSLVGVAILSVALITQREPGQATTAAKGNGTSIQGNAAQLPTGVATAPPPMATGGLPTPASTYSPLAGTNVPATVERHEEPTPAYDPSRFTPSPIPPLRQASFDTWSYTASRDELGNLFAFITRDTKKIPSLQAFATANKASALQMASSDKDVDVYITYRNYMSVEQFRDWAKAHKLQVQAVGLRTVDAGGQRATMVILPPGVLPKTDDPLPQSELDGMIKPAMSDGRIKELRGVMYARANVVATQLTSIANDPLVFISDVTPNIVRTDLVANGISDGATVRVQTDSPFWDMEDMGLDNFRK